MEIRTISAHERLAVGLLLDDWPLAEGWSAGDRFRRQVEFDPSFVDDMVWVAEDGGDLVATLTIFSRQLKILGHSIPTGGIGNLYTKAGHRSQGIGTALVEHACDAMSSRGLELAVLFSGAKARATTGAGAKDSQPTDADGLGWHRWSGQRTILRHNAGAEHHASESPDVLEFAAVARGDARTIQSVKAIHTAYCATRSGTVDRDDALWQACLDLKPAPREEFWVARRGGLAVAYARAAIVDDVLTLTEIGRFGEGAEALAKLIANLVSPKSPDPLAGPGLSSAELRSFAVLPTFDDLGLTVALEQHGMGSHPMDDEGALFRCVNLSGLAGRLDVDLFPGEDGPNFLKRILPPDGMVFWPADRF